MSLLKTYSTYKELGLVDLSIRFPVFISVHKDEDGPYVVPLIDLQHYQILAKTAKSVFRSELRKIYDECYKAAVNV